MSKHFEDLKEGQETTGEFYADIFEPDLRGLHLTCHALAKFLGGGYTLKGFNAVRFPQRISAHEPVFVNLVVDGLTSKPEDTEGTAVIGFKVLLRGEELASGSATVFVPFRS